MKYHDLKYLLAYLGPLSAYLAILQGGITSFAGVLLAFAIIPILELLLPVNHEREAEDEVQRRKRLKVFDWLLYLNLPILFGLIYLLLWRAQSELLWWELAGMTLGVGIYVGASGINVAHELGHRKSRWERLLSQVLLLPALYMHFHIEHNHGHHRYVATLEDPATARYGENLYSFWIRSIWGSLLSAWGIEARRLQQAELKVWSTKNRMLQYIVLEFLYLALVFMWFNAVGLILAVIIALIGVLLLETINYIEHYGLQRNKTASGRYERVGMQHSWNSNHEIGRIFLYELTRHADHHYKASKKYQELQHVTNSPQLPTGYPGSMLLALVPPLWFRMIDPMVPPEMISSISAA